MSLFLTPLISLTETIVLSERLLSIAVILQTLELFQIRSFWSDQGIWRWSTLKKEFTNPVFSILFSDTGFSMILCLRFFLAIMTWFTPCTLINAYLFLSTWLISIRWRGLFNGGSDSMTIVVSIGLTAARGLTDYPAIAKYALAYIAIQLTFSYLIAGFVKLKNHEWRSGIAMPAFLKTPRYDSPPDSIRRLFNSPSRSKVVSWIIILIECSFPMAWLNPNWCLPFLALAFVFHFLNYWIFGLNRFVFTWLSAYPALYFWSQQ